MSLKNLFIKNICDELSGINGTEFEGIGKYIMELATGKEIVQKGHNLCQKPVKSTVDLIQLSDVEVVGQCGTDVGYFEKKTKPENDIRSSIKNCPKCKKILLFSNRRITGGQLPEIKTYLDNIDPSRVIDIYDSERIANLMYDNIMHDKAISNILAVLPQSRHYYNIFVHHFRIPNLSTSYIHRPEEKIITDMLSSHDVIQLYGLSGIGKTQLSLAVALSLNENFDSIIWLKGDELDATNIKSIQLDSLDQHVNLGLLLSELHVLIIADNLEKDHMKFKEQFDCFNKKGSKCIISSKQRNFSPEISIEVSFVSNEVARNILLNSSIKPTETQIETLTKRINGYPLLLILSRNAVENNFFSWEELCDETTMLVQLTDENCANTFAQRIIEKYYSHNKKLFNIIASLDSTRICKGILKESDKIQFKNLISAAVIDESDVHYVRIHSVVLQSIKYELSCNGGIEIINDILQCYFEKHLIERNANLYSLMAAHGNCLLETAKTLPLDNDLRHEIVLANIYTSDTHSNFDYYLNLIDELTLSPESRIVDLKLKLEKNELEIYKLYDNKSKQMDWVEKSICELESFLIGITDPGFKAIIYHHLGKWNKLVGKYDKAEKRFQDTLNINPNAYNTRLQLARLYGKIYESSDDYIKKVSNQIELIMNDGVNEKVPLSILLSVYDLIATSKYDLLREKFLETAFPFFEKTIYTSVINNNHHVYYILSKLAKSLAYNHEVFFKDVCEVLPIPFDCRNDYLYDYANIMSALYEWCGKDEKDYEIAKKYFMLCKLDDDYKRKSILHLFTIHNDISEIGDLLSSFDEPNNVFNRQAFAKAYSSLNDFDTALEHINFAIDNEGDLKPYFKAAFRHDKAQILKNLSNKDCIQYIRQAIQLQNNPRTINDWEKEMREWENFFN